jgi:thioesterase domain-containing protein/SAM-dependent methyltransferase/acyl carrier protein
MQQDAAQAERFWRRELLGFRTPTRLQVLGTQPDRTALAEEGEWGDLEVCCTVDLTTALTTVARKHQVTLNTLIQGAWALLLSRYAGADDVVFGITVSGRPAELPDADRIVGMFINNVPVRIRLQPELPLGAWLRDLHSRQIEARAYDYTPLTQIREWSDLAPGVALFDTLLVFENYPRDASGMTGDGNLGVSDVRSHIRTAYPLSLAVLPGPALGFLLTYDRRYFDPEALAHLESHLQTILRGMTATSEPALSAIRLLTREEEQQANDRPVLLRDHWGQPPPIGVPGEIVRAADDANPEHQQTGEFAVILADGTVRSLGRREEQALVQGYRVAPTLVEAELATYPNVHECAVLARPDAAGVPTLVAYVVATTEDEPADRPMYSAAATVATLAHWQRYFDDVVYKDIAERRDPFLDPYFNPIGWMSSASGLPLSTSEVREMVEATAARVLALRPNRVLEIGCGTGLLLFMLAKHCSEYCATDFSAGAVDYVRRQFATADMPQVRLLCQPADDFAGIERGSFDVVIIHSVVQHFPSMDYLLRVIEGALLMVAPGGSVYIDDVINLPLREAFHASVEIQRSAPSASIDQLAARVRARTAHDRELAVDPAFFRTLPELFPQIGDVKVQLKRGRQANEFTAFRYDVALRVGVPTMLEAAPADDRQEARFSVGALRRRLVEAAPLMLTVRGVPNGRVLRDVKVVEALRAPSRSATVADLRFALRQYEEVGVGPEEIWDLSKDLPYTFELTWLDGDAPEAYSIVVRHVTIDPRAAAPALRSSAVRRAARANYANEPWRVIARDQLIADARQFLLSRLPPYMAPRAFVALDNLPRRPDGSLSETELPLPESPLTGSGRLYVPPRNDLERKLVAMWEQVLGIQPVGVTDDFFALGGHSLLAVSLLAHLERELGQRLPLTVLFQGGTVRQVARALQEGGADRQSSCVAPIQPEGKRAPYFIVDVWGHEVDGTLLYTRHFVARFGPDQPLYGLQWRGRADDEAGRPTVPEAAAVFIEAMRSVQPNGPYYVGGHSLGGIIAFEIACQLQRQGERVFVAQLDSPCPPFPDSDRPPPAVSRWRTLLRHVEALRRLPVRERAAYVDALTHLPRAVIGRHWRTLRALGPGGQVAYVQAKKNVLWHKLRHGGAVDRTAVELAAEITRRRDRYRLVELAGYVPGTFNGRLACFWSSGFLPLEGEHYRLAWREHASDGIDVHMVPGDHVSIIVEPNIYALADALAAWLTAVQEETGVTAVPVSS